MGVVLLIGLFFVLYVGPLFGPWGWIQALLIALVLVAPLTLIFLLAPVRRFFGVQAQ